MSERPVTPPPRNNGPASLNLTPEQVKRIELNRLKGMSSHPVARLGRVNGHQPRPDSANAKRSVA
jgi:hypothetical protein